MSRDPEELDGALSAQLRAARRREQERLDHDADDSVYGEFSAAEADELGHSLLSRLGAAPAQGAAAQASRPQQAAPRALALRRRRRTAFAVGALALAAAVLLMAWPSGPELPTYALVGPLADATVRAEGGERTGHTYTLGRELEFLFRPATESAAIAELAAFVREGSRFVPLEPEVERGSSGALIARLSTGPSGTLPLGAGRHELVFLLFAQGAFSADELAPDAPPDAVQRLSVTLTLIP